MLTGTLIAENIDAHRDFIAENIDAHRDFNMQRI